MKKLTIKNDIEFSGIGVHTGKYSIIILQPAKEDTGINFIKDNIKISLNLNNLEKSFLCTKIKKDNIGIFTVEHLLSAIYGLGITDLNILVEGIEIPILDGSTKIFVEKIYPELKELKTDAEYLELTESIYIRDKDKFLIAVPHDQLEISYFLDFEKFPWFISSKFIYSPQNYLKEISEARTFGFLSDAEYLNKNGLALGSSYENTLVINTNNYSSELRYFNEPARHKILDLIGDLAFLNKQLKARIICYKTGHAEHLKLVENILKDLSIKTVL